MPHERQKELNDLQDVLIVQKIELKNFDERFKNLSDHQTTECLCFESECDCKKKLEEEALKKRQYQKLAIERGKLAYLSEIATLKEKEENRSLLIRARQQALDIEKERALKIASLPPPLPKSVKLLLKQNDNEPKLSKPDVQMPAELTAVHIEPINISCKSNENKENIIDPVELAFKQKMCEEWDMKAKQRYYEALKKDRQKEEYSKTMKQIQNAELLKRQEMAKSISTAEKGMPCPLSDKIMSARKQFDMEDETERIFKKTGTKEHVIEDIEGYQDCYEEKYKKIDSTTEAKMIDCVPSFLKENYDYLLQDDSKFHGGKNFSGFDDSTDFLNQAYIETSPGDDEHCERRNIHHEISQLDKLRSSLETEIEQNYIPLLTAAIEIPKKESKDQAVETIFFKVPAEDKAVETDTVVKSSPTSPSPTATFKFENAGVMAFKRRPRFPTLNTYQDLPLPKMHQRDVHYVIPLASESTESAESWSQSTYCSLPSKHGIPTSPSGSRSAVCDICIAERKKGQMDGNIQKLIPTSAVFDKEKFRNSTAFSEKNSLSDIVQQVAEKYLVPKSTENSQRNESNIISHSDSAYSNMKPTNSAFKKEVIEKSNSDIFNEFCESKEFVSKSTKDILSKAKKENQTSPLAVEKINPVTKTETFKMDESKKDLIEKEELLDSSIYYKIKDNETLKNPQEYSDYEYEAKRIQAVHQVLSRNFSRFGRAENDKSEQKSNGTEAKLLYFPSQNEIIDKPIYHELSTIREEDSALTSSGLQLSQPKLSDISETREKKDAAPKAKLNISVQSAENLKMVSLLDPPDSKIAELAKSIHFIPETDKKINPSLESSETDFLSSSSDKNTASKDLSTPTLTSGSYSTVSIQTPSLSSSDSTPSILSVASKSNGDSHKGIVMCNLGIQNRSYSGKLKLKDEQIINTIVSGYISETNMLWGSAGDTPNSHKETIEKHSIVSGYISDLEVQHASASNVQHFAQDKKDKIHSISGYVSDSDGSQMAIQLQSKISTDYFKPMTPISNVSSPSSDIFSLNDKYKECDSVESFKPMIPYSNVLSPSELATENFEKDIQNYNNHSNFKFSIPHCNILSSANATNSFNSKQEKYDNTGHFKPMTPYSNVSSPSELVPHNFEKGSNSAGSYKALTPSSNVSSPTSDVPLSFENAPISDACHRKFKNKLSSENSEIKPIMFRFNISTDSLALSATKNKSSETKHVSQLNCNLTLKTVLKPTNYDSAEQLPRTDIISGAINNNIKYGKKSKNNIKKGYKGLHLTRGKQFALACSSDFFIPSLNDTSNFLNDKNEDLSTFPSAKNDNLNKQESVDGPQMAVIDDPKNHKDLENMSKDNDSNSKQITSGKEVLNKNTEEKILVMSSKEAHLTQVRLEKLRKQDSSMQGLSSASSSSENLSVISRSKVAFQSTPIKNMSELLQEPNILEEPTLTLITTDLSCKIDTTELQKGPLTSVSSPEPLDKEKRPIAESSENECKTPTSPQFLYSPDTPSMISFLQHEQSCQLTGNNSVSVQAPIDKSSVPQVVQENNTPVSRDVKRSLFQKDQYKERTKRLWNNLEEVRKRNLAEERRKEIENNRRKAKEFSKKLTPKQRRK